MNKYRIQVTKLCIANVSEAISVKLAPEGKSLLEIMQGLLQTQKVALAYIEAEDIETAFNKILQEAKKGADCRIEFASGLVIKGGIKFGYQKPWKRFKSLVRTIKPVEAKGIPKIV